MNTSGQNTGPLGQPRGIGFAILMTIVTLTTDHTTQIGATVSESEILHTKGGWRDHSDGIRNQVTTETTM